MHRFERGGRSRGKSTHPRRGAYSSRHRGRDHTSRRWESQTTEAERFVRHESAEAERWEDDWVCEDFDRKKYRRSISRDRSRSRSFHTDRDRREHVWDNHRDDYYHLNEEYERRYRNEDYRSSKKYNPYHWKKEDYADLDVRHEQDVSNDGVQDLREIIKRSRDETRSPRSRDDYDEMHCNDSRDNYFQEFVPKSNEEERRSSRWGRNEKQNTPELKLNFKKSIFNDIAVSSTSQVNIEGGPFMSAKDSHPEIPVFNELNQDLTPRQFLQIIERIGDTYGWGSNELKCQMAAKLQGSTREWFLKDELMNKSWEKVKSQFIKMHPMDMDYHQQLCKMMDRTQYKNEPFSNYFTFKTMLLSPVEITGRKAVSCLIGGFFDSEVRRVCYDKNFASPEEMYEYLNSKELDADVSTQKRKHSSTLSPKKSLQYVSRQTKSSHSYTEPENKEISLNNLLKDEEDEFSDEPFSLSKPNYDLKHLITVKIENNNLDAYNDLDAQCLTIKEHTANMINMDYSRRRTTIIGFRGVPVLALGDTEVRVTVDQAKVRTKIYIVPNISQEKPVVIGKIFRDHRDLIYHDYANSISFIPRNYSSSSGGSEKKDK